MVFRAQYEHNASETRPETLFGASVAQRGAGVTGRNEPKRVSATLKNFFRKIPNGGVWMGSE